MKKIKDTIKEKITNSFESLDVKTRQKVLLASSVVVFGGVFVVILNSFLNPLDPTNLDVEKDERKSLNLKTPSDTVDPNMSWRINMEAENLELRKEIKALKNAGIQKKPLDEEDIKRRKDAEKVIEEIRLEIDVLKDSINEKKESIEDNKELIKESSKFSENNHQLKKNLMTPSMMVPFTSPNLEEAPVMGVRKLVLEKPSGKLTQSIDTHVPAGTFARAIILGGVDASTSVQSSSDPRPVLLRVIDKGTLPRKFHSDLADVHILASAYGDLSSERVMMRLEKLTIVESLTGEITEVSLKGYVAGEDGKAGVRGVVVDRATPQIRNAFLGGLVGGLGSFFSKSLSSGGTSISPFGVTTQPKYSTSEMLKAGAGSGLSSAFSKLSEFYIKRAEQMQPVIQVSAGRVIDIVITSGVDLNKSNVRHAKAEYNDKERYKSIKENYSSSLPFSIKRPTDEE